jgi:hypothetical protein
MAGAYDPLASELLQDRTRALKIGCISTAANPSTSGQSVAGESVAEMRSQFPPERFLAKVRGQIQALSDHSLPSVRSERF